MPNLLQLAKLSEAIYSPQAIGHSPVAGWSCTHFRQASGVLSGFQAAIFQRNAESVVAFRGTAQGMDGIADLKLGLGMNSTYFDEAEKFVAANASFLKRSQDNVTVTGHSLGGAIAQIIANRCGIKMATFNAPGVGVIASRNIHQSTDEMNTVRLAGLLASAIRHPFQAFQDVLNAFRIVRGINICLKNDLVSQVGNHYGKVYRIPGTSSNPLTEHGIKTVVAVLEKNPALANRMPTSF